MLEHDLASFPDRFRKQNIDPRALNEAKHRVLDSIGCFYGAFNQKPARLIRETLARPTKGAVSLWGTSQRVPAETAAWANGTAVRLLDYNDTYLSKEPCHPSDLISSLWAACEISGSKNQGALLLKAMVLGYEVLCRLCDANSLRLRGWDHINYVSIASAVSCSYILGLSTEQTRHAVALAVTGNNAMRQTRVGTISDWKAACAAYAARSGLWAARLAKAGFTGPSDIFSGRFGFFHQVSGAFKLPDRPLGKPWMILKTHTKFFPAEHHAQSAIEAALQLRNEIRRPGNSQSRAHFTGKNGSWTCSTRTFQDDDIRQIIIETFDVAVSIIGSEKEKWKPTTRETADHSMPYLVSAALLDGDINLNQYEKRRYLDADVRRLMARTKIKNSAVLSRRYPHQMPTRVTLVLKGGRRLSHEIGLPKGYAGRPMVESELIAKFQRLTGKLLKTYQQKRLMQTLFSIGKVRKLKNVSAQMVVR